MKSNLFFIFSLFLFFSAFSFAQTPNWLWAKSAGGNANDKALSIAADTQGNIYVTGYFYSPAITFGSTTLVNQGMFLTRFNSSGNILWAKDAIGVSNGNSITTDNVGNIYVVGYFSSKTISFDSFVLTKTDTTSAWDNLFIVKYDSSGKVIWAKSANHNTASGAYSVASDNFGNIFVAGIYWDTLIIGADTLGNNNDRFIAKYDTAGNPIWAKSIYTSGYSDLSVASDKFGNVCIAGDFGAGTLTIGTYTLTNQGNQDIFAAKFNPAGSVLWAKSYGNFGDDEGTSIATDTSGNIYISGFFTSTSIAFGSTTLWTGGNNIFVVKNNGAGNTLWAKSAHGNNYIKAPSITADKSGNAYVSGYFSSSSLIFDASDSLINKGMFLAKYDANGNYKWARDALGGSRATAVTVDALGNPYVTGYFSSNTLGFDSTVLLNDTTSSFDIFVAAIGSITGIENITNDEYANIIAYPNPFVNNLQIAFFMEKENNITATIFNSMGQQVKTLANGTLLEGQHYLSFNTSFLMPGVYFIKLDIGEKHFAKAMIKTSSE